MKNRLTKGSSPILGGVVSGFADFFGVDPLPLRLLFVGLMFVNVLFGFVYVISWIVMPDYPGTPQKNPDRQKSGFIILVLGVLLLLKNFFPQLTLSVLAAFALIGLGIYLIVQHKS